MRVVSNQPVERLLLRAFHPLLLMLPLLFCGVAGGQAQTRANGVDMLPEQPLTAFALQGSAAEEATLEVVAVEDQAFSQALRVETQATPEEPYHIQLQAQTTEPVVKGDNLVATFWVRKLSSTPDPGRIGVVFEQADDPYLKSLWEEIDIASSWQQHEMPFVAAASFPAGQTNVNFRVGYGPQTLEIAGISVVNYGGGSGAYDGFDENAAWREEAEARIERIRQADLVVRVVDSNGAPVPNATVDVQMQRHAFPFGSAIHSSWFVGDRAQTEDAKRYRTMLRRLFNTVTFESNMKWPNWEVAAARQRVLTTLVYLTERLEKQSQPIAVRGHTLVWPSWERTPEDLYMLRDDPDALRQRVAEHITSQVGELKENIYTWDVVNEPFNHHDLLDILGNQAMVSWFELARRADPTAVLVLNEALRPDPSDPKMNSFEETARFLMAQGAQIGGLGFQSHYQSREELTSPEDLLEAFDRFGELGLELQITEFDVQIENETLQADYLRDFFTAAFSHPAVTQITQWGFWEGQHWRPEAALWREDWSIKPNGEAYLELVFDQWWTAEQGHTDQGGQYATRGFLGDYDVTVTSAGVSTTVEATLTKESEIIEVSLGDSK